MTKRFLLIVTLLFTVIFYFTPQPEAKAIDPVTIAILAPIAIKAAKVMAPYLIRALGNMGIVLAKAGLYAIKMLLLPVGIVECTFLAPWFFKAGINNLWQGGSAPFVMCFYILILPLSVFGVGVGS